MKAKEFHKLLEKHKNNPQELIRMHCNRDIYLTGYQFDKVVEIRDRKKNSYGENNNNNTSDSIIRRTINYFRGIGTDEKM